MQSVTGFLTVVPSSSIACERSQRVRSLLSLDPGSRSPGRYIGPAPLTDLVGGDFAIDGEEPGFNGEDVHQYIVADYLS
jgi:hypothetical protein